MYCQHVVITKANTVMPKLMMMVIMVAFLAAIHKTKIHSKTLVISNSSMPLSWSGESNFQSLRPTGSPSPRSTPTPINSSTSSPVIVPTKHLLIIDNNKTTPAIAAATGSAKKNGNIVHSVRRASAMMWYHRSRNQEKNVDRKPASATAAPSGATVSDHPPSRKLLASFEDDDPAAAAFQRDKESTTFCSEGMVLERRTENKESGDVCRFVASATGDKGFSCPLRTDRRADGGGKGGVSSGNDDGGLSRYLFSFDHDLWYGPPCVAVAAAPFCVMPLSAHKELPPDKEASSPLGPPPPCRAAQWIEPDAKARLKAEKRRSGARKRRSQVVRVNGRRRDDNAGRSPAERMNTKPPRSASSRQDNDGVEQNVVERREVVKTGLSLVKTLAETPSFSATGSTPPPIPPMLSAVSASEAVPLSSLPILGVLQPVATPPSSSSSLSNDDFGELLAWFMPAVVGAALVALVAFASASLAFSRKAREADERKQRKRRARRGGRGPDDAPSDGKDKLLSSPSSSSSSCCSPSSSSSSEVEDEELDSFHDDDDDDDDIKGHNPRRQSWSSRSAPPPSALPLDIALLMSSSSVSCDEPTLNHRHRPCTALSSDCASSTPSSPGTPEYMQRHHKGRHRDANEEESDDDDESPRTAKRSRRLRLHRHRHLGWARRVPFSWCLAAGSKRRGSPRTATANRNESDAASSTVATTATTSNGCLVARVSRLAASAAACRASVSAAVHAAASHAASSSRSVLASLSAPFVTVFSFVAASLSATLSAAAAHVAGCVRALRAVRAEAVSLLSMLLRSFRKGIASLNSAITCVVSCPFSTWDFFVRCTSALGDKVLSLASAVCQALSWLVSDAASGGHVSAPSHDRPPPPPPPPS